MYFAAAARSGDGAGTGEPPFASRYRVAWQDAAKPDPDGTPSFFASHYGHEGAIEPGPPPERPYEVATVAGWRRIDDDWLYASDQLALDMSDQTNNSSLALAFELGLGGKVLLFAADATMVLCAKPGPSHWKSPMKCTLVKPLASVVV